MTVALVISSRNQARFLAQAIDSALAQSRAFDELIVVDAGSTDETPEVAARYPAVRYLRQEHTGVAAIRNAGISATASSHIVFLEAKDRLLVECVAAGLRCFAANPECGFAFGHFRWMAEDGSMQEAPPFDPCPQDAYGAILLRNLVAMGATVMYRRAAIMESGSYDTGLPAFADYELCLRLARRYRVDSHRTVIAECRKHAKSPPDDLSLMLKTILEILERQRPHIAGDARHRAALNSALKNWKMHYGMRIARKVVVSWRTGTAKGQVMREASALVRYAPRTVLHLGVRVILPYLPSFARTAVMRSWPQLEYSPRVGSVRLGDLRRLTPISREYGFDRGTPVDRYYISEFLLRHSAQIRGRVLEVGDRDYTGRYGGDRVSHSDVLNVRADVPGTTIVGDLTHGDGVADAAFDCIVLTQTLHLLFDVRAAIRTLHRILRPGGTLLLTVPGTISQIESGVWQAVWYWGFTRLSLERLMGEVFDLQTAETVVYGNVLASIAFLEGLASEELNAEELDHRDPLYPLLIGIKVTKAS